MGSLPLYGGTFARSYSVSIKGRKRRDPSVCNPSVCKRMKEHSRNRTLDREDIGIQRALPLFCQDHQGPKNVLTTFPLKFAKGMVKKVQVWPPPKGQQLRGKIVLALFHPFSHLFTLLQNFSPRTSLEIKASLNHEWPEYGWQT